MYRNTDVYQDVGQGSSTWFCVVLGGSGGVLSRSYKLNTLLAMVCSG